MECMVAWRPPLLCARATAETPGSPPVPPRCTLLAEVGDAGWGPGPLGGGGTLPGRRGRRAPGRAGGSGGTPYGHPQASLGVVLPAPSRALGQTHTPEPARSPPGPPPFTLNRTQGSCPPSTPGRPSCPARPAVSRGDGRQVRLGTPPAASRTMSSAAGLRGPGAPGQGLHTAPCGGPRRGPGSYTPLTVPPTLGDRCRCAWGEQSVRS